MGRDWAGKVYKAGESLTNNNASRAFAALRATLVEGLTTLRGEPENDVPLTPSEAVVGHSHTRDSRAQEAALKRLATDALEFSRADYKGVFTQKLEDKKKKQMTGTRW